jgi:hypothetical protein
MKMAGKGGRIPQSIFGKRCDVLRKCVAPEIAVLKMALYVIARPVRAVAIHLLAKGEIASSLRSSQ